MELERVETGDTYEGKKRQHLPYELTFTCPECGEEHTREFHSPGHYLSYPTWGEPHEVELFCENSDSFEPAKTVEVTPKISLEIEE